MGNNEQDEKLRQSQKVKDLVKSDVFQDLLKILALRIKESDTVRDIDIDQDLNTVAIKQIARKLAVDMIESWLEEIIGIYNFEEFTEKNIESQGDNIVRQLK